MKQKIATLLIISAAMTIAETILVYLMRTKGPMPFKIKFTPDFEI